VVLVLEAARVRLRAGPLEVAATVVAVMPREVAAMGAQVAAARLPTPVPPVYHRAVARSPVWPQPGVLR